MPYEVYKIIHFTGIILIISTLIGLLTLRMNQVVPTGSTKKIIFIGHGIGMLLAIVGGFGLLARLGLASDMPNWVYVKLLIWLIFGGAISLVRRKGHIGSTLFIALITLFVIGAITAVFKPF